VLAQVALTTKVERCIGVEVRAELCSIATRQIRQHADTYPQLRKVELKPADVRDVLMSTQPPTSEATVIFANYVLFEEAAKLVVARELSAMPKARVIASTSLFCPRHRLRCPDAFCARWKLTRELKAQCSWKSSLTSLYIYLRT
jgi:hypothetical protein